MSLVFIIILGLSLICSAGIITTQRREIKWLRGRPQPPQLDSPSDILNYLEACTVDKQNYDMKEIFDDFEKFLNQKALPEKTTINIVNAPTKPTEPDWYHNTKAPISSKEHWELFLEDFNLEQTPDAKYKVVKHWLDRKVCFTNKEMNYILATFAVNQPLAREGIRELFTSYKLKDDKEYVEKKKEPIKKIKAIRKKNLKKETNG